MSLQPPRWLSVLASALATAGLVLAVAGCSNVTPLSPEPAPVSLPPARNLGSPIVMQVMRSQSPTPAGVCPASSISLFGLDPGAPRATVVTFGPAPAGAGSTAPPSASPAPALTTPATPPAGVACFVPAGTPVTVTSAAVSSVTTNPNHPGGTWYEFVVAFPAAYVAALTALIQQAYNSGDSLGMSVAGQLWQAPRPVSKISALRAEQINLTSRDQAVQLHGLLVPAS